MNPAKLALVTAVTLAALAAFWAGTALMRRYALRTQMLDVPNELSSHSVPTPRGGGVAIVLAYLAGLLALWSGGAVATAPVAALVGAVALVATLGFVDDRRPLPAR
jgi:Fuc2NAc and GlcNAc transferase